MDLVTPGVDPVDLAVLLHAVPWNPATDFRSARLMVWPPEDFVVDTLTQRTFEYGLNPTSVNRIEL